MDWKQFTLNLLTLGQGYLKLLLPAFLVGLHMKQPWYMKKKDG